MNSWVNHENREILARLERLEEHEIVLTLLCERILEHVAPLTYRAPVGISFKTLSGKV